LRAIRLRSPAGLDRLEIDTAPLPAVGPGEIRVRLHASSLNYHDYMVVTGIIPVSDGRIPMSDGAGDVTEVGEGVTEFALGDRVVSSFFPRWLEGRLGPDSQSVLPGDRDDGYARDAVVAPATAFAHAPTGYSHAEAATLPCAALTAWRALFVEANVTPGNTVLVQGTGGVSIFALQFAKTAGATVIATSSSGEKLERLRAIGADHVINYREDETWGATAKRLTGGRGVDHVVDIAGSFKQSFAACRIGAHVALVAGLGGASKFPVMSMIGKNLKLSGLTVGSREQLRTMIRAIEANGIRPVIDSSFPLEGIADAFRHQETGRHFGKICLEW
jgi:NADPH:quinone reductase-like Zn-dependent oxidoreductase